MSEIDQQFIEYVVKSLVGHPDAVQIKRSIDEKGVLLELTVDPEDLGRVIGKRGATAQSLRTLLRALGTKNDARYNLKIIDNSIGDNSNGKADDQKHPADDAQDTTDESSESEQESPQPEQTEEPSVSVEESAPEASEEESETDETSDRLAKSRRELADLDD